MKSKGKEIVKNKKAFFDYEILESWEAGIELYGHEVKSVRAWQVNLKGNYVSFMSGELYLKWMHISTWKALPGSMKSVTDRERKLFLKKKTVNYLWVKLHEKGHTILALSLYLKWSLIKAQIALVKGKKQYQKKDTIKKKTIQKDIQRAMSKNY